LESGSRGNIHSLPDDNGKNSRGSVGKEKVAALCNIFNVRLLMESKKLRIAIIASIYYSHRDS